jgi:hypothetical protein
MVDRPVRMSRLLALICGLAVAAPVAASAQATGPRNEGALFLLLPVGAQGVAMGRSMTATPSVESAFWNPAGLGALDESRFLVFQGDQLAGESTAISALWANQPIGVFGLSWQLLDGGEIDFTDDQGNVRGKIELRSHLGVASFATSVLPWLRAGLNLKFIQENFDCIGPCEGLGVQSNGWAVDAGLQVSDPGGAPIRLGVMIANLGPDFQVVNASQSDPLPTRLRVSAGYNALSQFDVPDMRLWLHVEVEDRWKGLGTQRSLYFGAEFEAGRGDVIYIRSGYVNGEVGQADGFAVGVGLRYERFELGLGKNLAGSITGDSEPVHVSFGIVF